MIEISDVQLTRNVQTPGSDGKIMNRLTFMGLLTRTVMRDLGASWLAFDKGGIVRSGFESVALDAEYRDAQIKHQVKIGTKVSNLEMNGTIADKFFAHRIGSGKKPKKLLLSFRVSYSGPPFDLNEHWMKIGKGEGSLIINAPEQQELPGVTKPVKEAKPKTVAIRKVKK